MSMQTDVIWCGVLYRTSVRYGYQSFIVTQWVIGLVSGHEVNIITIDPQHYQLNTIIIHSCYRKDLNSSRMQLDRLWRPRGYQTSDEESCKGVFRKCDYVYSLTSIQAKCKCLHCDMKISTLIYLVDWKPLCCWYQTSDEESCNDVFRKCDYLY